MVNSDCRLKQRRTVAVFAEIAGQNMSLVFADRVYSVMAARAVIGKASMIESSRHPSIRRMTIITIVAAGNMRLVLACRNSSVVAG